LRQGSLARGIVDGTDCAPAALSRVGRHRIAGRCRRAATLRITRNAGICGFAACSRDGFLFFVDDAVEIVDRFVEGTVSAGPRPGASTRAEIVSTAAGSTGLGTTAPGALLGATARATLRAAVTALRSCSSALALRATDARIAGLPGSRAIALRAAISARDPVGTPGFTARTARRAWRLTCIRAAG
jgi:hypothetical protein